MPGGFGGCVSSLLAQFGRGAASDALNSEERPMQLKTMIVAFVGAGLFGAVIASAAPSSKEAAASPPRQGFDAEITRSAQAMLDEDRKTFRYETFGIEAFWGDALQLHKAIACERNGGVGPGVSPKTALHVGLKVDVDPLPDALKQQLKAGKVDLEDPATTIALLKLNAVVGVTAFANPDGSLESMGISARSATRPSTARSRRASASGSTELSCVRQPSVLPRVASAVTSTSISAARKRTIWWSI
jgi:hypothetical protein